MTDTAVHTPGLVREQIYDLQVRYGRANDTHDEDLIRSCFTDDMVAHYEPWSGPPIEGWESFVDFWRAGSKPLAGEHQFTNFTFDIGEDTGSYTCLAIVTHWRWGAELAWNIPMMRSGVRYENTVRRTQSGWRITRLHLITLWLSGDSTLLDHFPGGLDETPHDTEER